MQTDGRSGRPRAAHHLIPSAYFEDLAAGRGGPGTIRFLRRTEYSRRLLLLRALLDTMAATPGALGPLSPVDSAWDTLTAAQEAAPEEFRELLLHPQIGIWLGHSIRRLTHTAWGDGPLWTDLGHLYAVCSVAALRAGLALRTTVPVRDGTAMFPTLGLACLSGRPRWGTAEVVVAEGRLRVDAYGESVGPPEPPGTSGGDAPGWQGLRTLRADAAGRPVAVLLDDIDPYRDLSEPLPARRLGKDRITRWQELFGGALGLLARVDPDTAAAVAEGLRTVTDVEPAPGGVVLSASSGDAFGGVLTSLPPDPVTLAVTLVHEFQHTKLGALLHLLTLEQDSGAERHYAPWRDDPRPLGGLLQGAYAFLGITDFWCRYLDEAPRAERPLAEFEFALRRRQTEEAVRVLAADPGLTGHGRRFLRGMTARLSSWWGDDRIRPDVAALAEFVARDHRTGWRIRHLSPAPEDVRALARAFAAGLPAGFRLARSSVVPDLAAPWSHARTWLVRCRLGAPPGDGRPAASVADRALVSGDPAAADAYARLLADDPESADAWTGLVLAADPDGTLLGRPELPRAVHRELRVTGTPADPRRVTLWLASRPG
ncbi:HEXXH motif-containing putative peptide modification protein [Streptomyces sp. NPDC059688]|uniref:aKG-HExxH-type peptide beta-hydroxylase n=1 Tax=Streptomyces sp. NPDC059688 TaxID=3346906 RepID=UPI0036AC2944